MNTESGKDLRLYMLLLGATPPGRHTEQHDFFFSIAGSLQELVPLIKAFWPEAGERIHIDGWREVKMVDGYRIQVILKDQPPVGEQSKKLFFINLGGYQPNKLEEQHYTVLTVQEERGAAIAKSKKTIFYRTNSTSDPGGGSHIDDKYGIDVDDVYEIEDILSPELKEKYRILISPAGDLPEDEIHLGYLKLSKLLEKSPERLNFN